MHYQVLARKWRPKQFSELIGQPHIVRTLQNSLLQGRIAQAYLLAGTRGVGKTTVARIFAKAIRCENLSREANPCNVCKSCIDMDSQSSMDIMEIDGASHNGVESIRSLIDNVQYLPTSGKYKVYVIDEVHMLSVSAFNALLKTLEEPPAHVIFIFATTDPEKLLKTVLSRCQRLDFRNVQEDILIEHVKNISKTENIHFESENLIRELANLGKGSVRDTLSLLDQLLSMSENNEITEEVFSLALGVAKESQVKEIVFSMCQEDTEKIKSIFNDVFKNNIDIKSFSAQIGHELFELTQSEIKREELGVNLDEAFWIFEVFNKEISWGLESLHPREVVLLLFQKIAYRGQFFQKQEKKKIINKAQNPSLVQASVKKKFKWSEFVESVASESLAVAQSLKRAILSNASEVENGSRHLKLTYKIADEVLYGHISTKETLASIKNWLQIYDEGSAWEVEVNTSDESEPNLKSIAENEEIKSIEQQKLKEQKIKSNPYVVLAEKLFNTKLDKIVIDDFTKE